MATESRTKVPRAAYYVLALVTLVNLVQFIDRQIVAILVPPIKEEFHLSDYELGLLLGPAFAIIYSVITIFLSIAADRVNRRNVIGASVAAFSAATLFSGFAGAFWQLLAGRFGVGAGQAGTSPPITSMLADLFPRERRATAISIYHSGANMGMLVSFLLGGWLAANYGWRTAFIVAGIPGILLAILWQFTVKEPVRGGIEKRSDTAAPSFFEALRVLWRSPTYRYIVLGTTIRTISGYGITYFFTAFMIRSHHLTLEQAGWASAFLFGFCGMLGTGFGGTVADYFSKRSIKAQLYVPVAIMWICAPLVPVMLLLENFWLAMAAAILPMTLNAAYTGPIYAVMQGVSPLRVRALSIGVFLFIITIVGLSFGPMVVGKVSDLLRPAFGEDSLRYALLIHCPGMLIAGFFFLLGARTLIADMEKVK